MLLKLLVYFQILVFFVVGNDNKCSSTLRREIESHLATKTPYRVIANKNDATLEYKDCSPLRIWGIIRHGSRNPSRKVIRRAKDQLMKLREKILASINTKLCPHELAMFRNWSFNIDEDNEKYLVYEGEDEMIELAERLQKRFPQLLSDIYHPDRYKFKYTATQRTLKSAESFATGLFGRNNLKNIVYPEPLHKDPVLRFYKLCNKWKKEVDKNPDALAEVKRFREGNETRTVIQRVQLKTGVSSILPEDLHLMYAICAFETAWNKQRDSPWCSLFDEESIKVLEFTEDLEYFWIDGYGYDLTYKQACPAVIDMITHLEQSSIEPNATFYFTHSGTMLKLLAHLGLYKDDFVLTHEDFTKERKWSVSKIDAFASNLIFINYQCKNELEMLVLHQERIIKLPGCPIDKDLCSFELFKKLFKESIHNCHFNELCGIV